MECFVSSDDLQLLMNRFDKNKDGRISMRDVRFTGVTLYSLRVSSLRSLPLTIDVCTML